MVRRQAPVSGGLGGPGVSVLSLSPSREARRECGTEAGESVGVPDSRIGKLDQLYNIR